MELTPLVTAAKLGDSSAFAKLVRLHQARLVASLDRWTGDRAAAEDLAQEVLLTAWEKVASLREAEAFPGWLGAIARNRALAWRAGRSRGPQVEGGDLVDRLPAAEPAEPGDLDRRLAGLPEAGRRLWRLRYEGGLSLRQTAAVLGIPEARVKSRLYELRRKLARPPRSGLVLEEELMDKIEALKLGAHVVERLSLDDQVRWIRAALAGREGDEVFLAALGRVDRGAEYLALYGTRPGLGEIVGILNHVDRFTEHRLVTHLETHDPTAAEAVKANLFVFEDLVLFDPPALAALYGHCDPAVFAAGLSGVEAAEKARIADRMPADLRSDLDRRLAAADTGSWAVRAAQESVVAEVHELERTGRLKVVRDGGPPGGGDGDPGPLTATRGSPTRRGSPADRPAGRGATTPGWPPAPRPGRPPGSRPGRTGGGARWRRRWAGPWAECPAHRCRRRYRRWLGCPPTPTQPPLP